MSCNGKPLEFNEESRTGTWEGHIQAHEGTLQSNRTNYIRSSLLCSMLEQFMGIIHLKNPSTNILRENAGHGIE